MKIACIGGGPAGLYLGILVKRSAPEHEVVVYERNRPADTFGFGVVFSDATLGHLAAADPETHAQITAEFARWDDIEIHVGGEVLRSTGHGFCGLERKTLLQILQARAQALGVRIEFEHEVKSLDELRDADVIVACDGVASWVRDKLAAEIQPRVDVRPNKFVWLGCTVPYDAFTFLFKQTQFGLFRVHAYRYQETGSTFIVECREDTWRAAGLATADEDQTVAILSDIFATELAGHKLIKNRSIWRNFPTVRCGHWHTGNVVLVGDAVHTAHFSIGSGTKLAMEDVIVLRDELVRIRERSQVPAALAAYEAKRRPEVEALQAAAQASLEWFEGTERYMTMAPVQFTYSLMTRSLRVSHASVAKRDPHLARGVEQLLAAGVGVHAMPATGTAGDSGLLPIASLGGGMPALPALPPPTALPCPLGDRRAANRIVLAPPPLPKTARESIAGDDELVALGAAASTGAGLVVTPPISVVGPTMPRINTDDQAVAWRRVVDYVHGKNALIVARISTAGAVPGALEQAIQRAAFSGFDMLLLDPGHDGPAIEYLPALVEIARQTWRKGGYIAACVHDRPTTRAAVVGHAAQLARAGADMLWVTSAGDITMTGARLPAAPLADRLRNELDIATAVDGSDAVLPDLDAAIAAGRADLVVVERMPAGARR
ncbi:MAG TPA: FAD-dependent monooxygenase [Kofleriaceae bacterium]|nr:FAD-dependent monooxygenase [Kofleriaceae bacterium]